MRYAVRIDVSVVVTAQVLHNLNLFPKILSRSELPEYIKFMGPITER